MSNFILSNIHLDSDLLLESINPVNTFVIEEKINHELVVFATYLKKSPLGGNRIFENDTWIAVFAGDLIGKTEINFKEFINILETKKYKDIFEIDGVYSFSAYNKKSKKYFLISDYRTQHPVYYLYKDDQVIFSNSISTFVKALAQPSFNEEWLYDYLYFNFPINNQSFLKDVFRMPPSSILEIDLLNNKKLIVEYHSFFKARSPLIKDEDALELAKNVFKERLPAFYSGAEKYACALTSGWDGRLNLALAPDYRKITAYTYGIPGCNDLIQGKEAARLADIQHKQIFFDEKFVSDLPKYIYETVYISSGLQNILRSTLIYVYNSLNEGFSQFPVTLSGIGYDLLFRGHLGLNVGTSKDMEIINRSGKVIFNDEQWEKIIIPKDYLKFKDFILNGLLEMKRNFGDYNDPQHHLTFHEYIALREHFSGELKIASNFTILRVPGWDRKIVELAFQIDRSCLTFSELAGYPKEGRKALELQAYLFKKLSPEFSRIRIRNTTPNVILMGASFYNVYQTISKAKSKVNAVLNGKRKRRTLLEDWNTWLNINHKKFIDEILFNKDTLIKNYLNESFLDEIKHQRNVLILGKLITVEVILQLIKNKWKRFW